MNVICPSCHAHMEEGYLQAHRYIFWEKKLHGPFAKAKDTRVVELVHKQTGFLDVTHEAHHCPNCKKIILEYSEPAGSE